MSARPDLRRHAEELLDHARKAPSLHNAQPWAFRVESGVVEVYADQGRALRVLDPDDRQLLISVGAALYVIRLGIAVLGAEPVTVLLPYGDAEIGTDQRGKIMVARVWVAAEHRPDPAEIRLLSQVGKRRTIRERMDPRIAEPTRKRLADAAAAEGVDLRWISRESDRTALGHLISMGESREQADPRIQAELAQWVGGQVARHGAGVPEEALGGPGEFGRAAMFAPRDFAGGRPRLAPDLEGQEEQPTVAVVSSAEDRPRDWLSVGQGLMHVLLAATADGLGTSYYNQPLELPDLRQRVREVVGLSGFPQLILRFGQPVEGWPVPTPRRPVEDLLLR